MDSDQLNAILNLLPSCQRKSARKRILWAEAAGWRHIGIWEWFRGRYHEADLVGTRPNVPEDEAFDFLFWEPDDAQTA